MAQKSIYISKEVLPDSVLYHEPFDYDIGANVANIKLLDKAGGSKVSHGYWIICLLIYPLINLAFTPPQWHIKLDNSTNNRYCFAEVYDGNASVLTLSKPIYELSRISFRYRANFDKKGQISFFMGGNKMLLDTSSHSWQEVSFEVSQYVETFQWIVDPHIGRAQFGLDDVKIEKIEKIQQIKQIKQIKQVKPTVIVQEKVHDRGDAFHLRMDSLMRKLEAISWGNEQCMVQISANLKQTKKAHSLHVRYSFSPFKKTHGRVLSAIAGYPLGKYEVEESICALLMMQTLEKTVQEELSPYLKKEMPILCNITGTADNVPIKGRIPYNGAYGDFHQAPFFMGNIERHLTITRQQGIITNSQLAFMRAASIEEYMIQKVQVLQQINLFFKKFIIVRSAQGDEFRNSSIELVIPLYMPSMQK